MKMGYVCLGFQPMCDYNEWFKLIEQNLMSFSNINQKGM
jgi:hypothetical protein